MNVTHVYRDSNHGFEWTVTGSDSAEFAAGFRFGIQQILFSGRGIDVLRKVAARDPHDEFDEGMAAAILHSVRRAI